jgi:hypothetical protein
MRDLPRYGAFDAITCLADALNYLKGEGDLIRAFRSAARNLAPHGLYVFDLNTLHTYRTTFASTVVVERDGLRMTWRGRTPATALAGEPAEAVVEVHDATGPLVVAGLERAGLDVVALFGMTPDGSCEPHLDELRHHKALYFARPVQ